MCRLLVFKGVESIQLSNLVTKPAHSIINQAFDARLRLDATRSVNGDGFGLGWYDAVECGAAAAETAVDGLPTVAHSHSTTTRTTNGQDANPQAPCIFTSVTPAWNNQNLQRLCEKIRSPLIFAHIRASTAGALSETNCHPWRFGRLMWMHNGQISSFSKLKRTLLSSLDDELLNFPQGQTDSEWVFALFLSHLDRPHREEAFDWKDLKVAMEKTIQDLNAWAKSKGVQEPSLMNFCVTDGLSILCTRYVSSLHDEAASLYFSSGTSFYEREKGRFRMRKEDRRQNIVVVASEPLTFEKADWMEVPTNTMIIITPKMNVLQIPILDEYSPIDRPSPSKTPRSPAIARGSDVGPLSRNSRAVNFTSPLQHCRNDLSPDVLGSLSREERRGTKGKGQDGYGDDDEDDEDESFLEKARQRNRRREGSTQRSPAFALHKGFPPNGHVGIGLGGPGPGPGSAGPSSGLPGVVVGVAGSAGTIGGVTGSNSTLPAVVGG